MFPHDLEKVQRAACLERYEEECIKLKPLNGSLSRKNRLTLNRLREDLHLTLEDVAPIHRRHFPDHRASYLEHPLAFISLAIVAGLLIYNLRELIPGNSDTLPPNQPPDNIHVAPKPKTNEVTGTYKYGGSTTWASVTGRVNPELLKAHPNFKVEDSLAGSPKGIESLLDENSDLAFAVSSRPLRSEEKNKGLREIPVAIDGIALVVRGDLDILSLSLDQLKGIYLSSIRNWRDLVNPDGSKGQNWTIIPYIRPAGGSTEVFEDILGIKQFGKNVEGKVRGKSNSFTTDFLQAIADDEQNQSLQSGIYPASASETVDQCSIKPLLLRKENNSEPVAPFQHPGCDPNKPIGERRSPNTEAFQNGTYPLTRRIYVVVNDKKPEGTQAGEFYASLLRSPQGQQLLEKAGFGKLPDL